MSDRLVITRELTDDWNKHTRPGQIVYRYRGYTYGCIAPGGIAVSLELGEPPFFEVPADAVDPVQWPDR